MKKNQHLEQSTTSQSPNTSQSWEEALSVLFVSVNELVQCIERMRDLSKTGTDACNTGMKVLRDLIEATEDKKEARRLQGEFAYLDRHFSALEQIKDLCWVADKVLNRGGPSLYLAYWLARQRRDAQDRIG